MEMFSKSLFLISKKRQIFFSQRGSSLHFLSIHERKLDALFIWNWCYIIIYL